MEWDRRTFLKTLLTWGVSQAGIEWFLREPKIQHYYQTLATPTPRKLALLVGINDYNNHFNLQGCVTDVERQQELLVHRFGFANGDILTLTGGQATREGIERAFTEHLIQQAKPGDVVLFHFSGYGNYVKGDPNQGSISPTQQRGLVPKDGILSTKNNPTTNDLLEETLLLLGRSLETDKLTMVLDTSYHYGGQELQGNLHGRTFPFEGQQPSPEEIDFQSQLKEQLKAKNIKIKPSQIPGTLLKAAQDQQVATEITGNGFSVGLFTYVLTQYLWQVTPNRKVIVASERTSEDMLPIRGKQQQPKVQPQDKQPLFTYYLLPTNSQGAEGIITEVEDKTTATIKLTGLPISVLQHYGLNSCLRIVDQQLSSPITVQLRSRDGLTGKVRLVQTSENQTETSPLKKGQLLQESLRLIPKTLGITVALDRNLQRIERVDATSAFSSMKMVSSVITAGEPGADCVLGRKQATLPPEDEDSSESETIGGYGLFLVGGVRVPNTFGQSGEAIKSAVERLQPALRKLLAVKWWRLTLNEGSSLLGLGASLENLDQDPSLVLQRQALRQISSKTSFSPSSETETLAHKPPSLTVSDLKDLPQLPQGSRLQYHLTNRSDRPIYYLILGVDASGQTIAYLPPYGKNQTQEKVSLSPGETRVVPASSRGLNWTVASNPGWEQIIIIGSQYPFEKTFETLGHLPGFKSDHGQILTLNDPLKVSQSILEDLDRVSAVSSDLVGTTTDSYVLDVSTWATLTFVYQVI